MPFYKRGSQGTEVTRIQIRLKVLGYYTGSVDGKFGGSMKRAVEAFQEAKGLSPDGVVGSKTMAFLFKKDTSKPRASVYKLGAKGDEVRKIQKMLQSKGFYHGPLDGHFGGGTWAAVKKFQNAEGFSADGIVGAKTWKVLFDEADGSAADDPGNIPRPSISEKPLDYKCLALTGSYETGKGVPDCFAGLSGDFDGQGISFGVLQWNFGQNSLQPLLKEMIDKHTKTIKDIFHTNYDILVEALDADKDELMTFARSIQHPVRHYVYEPWRGMFKALGRTEAYQEIQRKYAADLYEAAIDLCAEYELWSERAAALMFDIKVQNGRIRKLTKTQILTDVKALPNNLSDDELEVQKMRIVANRRAEASNPRWIEDVRSRKLCCANGEGTVHGHEYHLEEQYGIRLNY